VFLASDEFHFACVLGGTHRSRGQMSLATCVSFIVGVCWFMLSWDKYFCACSLLSSDLKPSQQTVEDNFDGMICRCTGYRPILDAMKSFSVDSKCHLNDIEVSGWCWSACCNRGSHELDI